MWHSRAFAALLTILVGCVAASGQPQGDARRERLIDHFSGGDPEPLATDLTRVWELGLPNSGYPIESRLDLEGNLIVITTPGLGGDVRKYKVFGDGQAGSVDGGQPVSVWVSPAPVSGVPLGLAVDFDGFIYVGQSDLLQSGYVQKLAPSGGIIWTSPEIDLGVAPITESYHGVKLVETTDDGVPIAAATTEDVGVDDTTSTIYQMNPFSGAIEWETELPGVRSDDMLITRDQQHVFVAGFRPSGVRVNIYKLRVADGSLVPGWPVQAGNFARAKIVEAPNGDIVVATSSFLNRPGYERIDPATGTRVVAADIPFEFQQGAGTDCAVAPDGAVYIAGRGSGSAENRKVLAKYSPSGVFEWRYDAPDNASYSGDILPYRGPFVEVDFCGDAYMLSIAANGDAWVAKFDADAPLGAANPEVQTFAHDPSFSHVRPSGLVVDPGLNVYAIGADALTQQVEPGSMLVLKYQQPNPYMPTTAMACPNLSAENRSVWVPGQGSIEKREIFSVLPMSLQNLGFGFGGSADTFLFGEFGGGLDFGINFDPMVGYRAYADGGTADVHVPLDVTWTVPSQISITPNSVVSISSDYAVNPAARLTTCVKPDFDAGLTGALDASVYLRAYATAFSSNLFDSVILNESASIEEDFLPYLSVGHWLGTGDLLGGDGGWIEKSDPLGLFGVQVRVPQLEQQAAFNPATGEFNAEARDRFFVASANITEIIMALIPDTVPVPPTSYDYSTSFSGFSVNAYAAFLQYLLLLNMEFTQGITVSDLDPWVRYDFSDGRDAVVQRLADDLNFQMPEASSEIIITPTVFMRTQMDNTTGVDFIPGQRFELLSAGASGSFKGWSLFDESVCLGCFESDFPSLGEITIYDPDPWDLDLPIGVNTTTGANGVRLAPIVVTGVEPSEPELVGLSRTTLGLRLYDQTQPTVSNFNFITGSTSKMLVYGDNFLESPSSEASRVMITLHGRTEELPTTWLNLNTMLCEIPNRFRVVPGVARIWVENDSGCSPAIDLPITYPVPVLDTINPNLWAADPSLLDVPLQVLDAETPVGSDSFISRRDYWVRLRNQLWNTSTTSDLDAATLSALDTDGNGVVSATEYFPEFDFNQVPGFPSVHFAGSPLARFVQPVDSGVHNVRLSPDNYASPGLAPVVICNPGPGGGMSSGRTHIVAAPQPVVSAVEPAHIEPGGLDLPFSDDGAFTLTITGPYDVPFVPGFEEEKRGNFNGSSVVYVNGIYDPGSNQMVGGVPLPTDFVNSGMVRAEIPNVFVQHPGTLDISVFTPDNGTEYFEEIREDTDGDGQPDGVVFQGFVPSGGVSNSVPIQVEFFFPVLLAIGTPETEAGNPVYDLAGPDATLPYYNFSVLGEYFRDGAQVLVDGSPRETMFVSREILRCKLLPSDVRVAGTRLISVRNPGTAADTTDTLEFQVLPRTTLKPSGVGMKGVGP